MSYHAIVITITITDHPTPKSLHGNPFYTLGQCSNPKPLPIFGARVKAEKTLDTIKVV